MSAASTDALAAADDPARARRTRLLNRLKIVFVLAVLAFVATRVPWSDRLTWSAGEVSGALSGRIDGDWKQDEVRFAPEGELPADLPAGLRARLVAEEPVQRGEGVDWQPGMPRVFGEVEPGGLLAALGFIVVGVFVTSTRWWMLLHAAGVRAAWYACVRLTSLGLFFNIVVPGLTGGDLVKAVLVAKENPGKRTAAVVSVFVDRVLGLLTLLAMGAAVIVAGGQFVELRKPVLLLGAAVVVGALVYTSGPLRRLVRFDALVGRLPMGSALQSLDQAVLIYSRHKRVLLVSFLISVGNHLMVIAAILALGRAFGDSVLGFLDYVVLVSIGNTASALPITPGGWGVGEAVYGYLYEQLGAVGTLGVAVSVGYRLCNTLIGLLGGVFMLLPGSREERAQLEELRKGSA